MEPNTLLRNNGLEYSVVSSECKNTGCKKGRGMYLQTLHQTATVLLTYNMQIAFMERTPGSENLITGT